MNQFDLNIPPVSSWIVDTQSRFIGNIANQITVIGFLENKVFNPLGTGFLVSANSFVTNRHVISNYMDKKLSAVVNWIDDIDTFQDTTRKSVTVLELSIVAENPLTDLAILKLGGETKYSGSVLDFAPLDSVKILEELWVLGYPHCTMSNIAFTCQKTELGAKVLLNSSSIKLKCGIVNLFSSNGQSGSMVFSPRQNKVVGILCGSFSYDCGLRIGEINPAALNTTTHILSAEYISNMLTD